MSDTEDRLNRMHKIDLNRFEIAMILIEFEQLVKKSDDETEKGIYKKLIYNIRVQLPMGDKMYQYGGQS